MRDGFRALSAGLFGLALLPAAGLAAGDPVPDLPADLAGLSIPQVLTPARLQQAQVDVAASVTIIDRDMIRSLGPRDIPELLRLVPGMMVTSTSGHEFSVNYHGTNLRDIRRLQVLIDGMSMYQPGLARVLWSDMPVSIDDIERIEVTRGPDAASYGANSFSGVINIITTHPQDSTDNMLRASGGTVRAFDNNRDTFDSGGRVVGHAPDSDWRLSFSTKADSGFDVDRYGANYRDDREIGVVNWRSEYRPTAQDRLELFGGFADTTKEEVAETYDIFTGYVEEPLVRTQNMNVQGRWTRELSPAHVLQVQAYAQETDIEHRWRSCLDPLLLSDELGALEAINQEYAFGLLDAAGDGIPAVGAYIATLPPDAQAAAMGVVGTYLAFAGAGYTNTCGDVNLDMRENRLDLEVQDTLRIDERLRIVSGAGYRRDSGSSESYVPGGKSNEVWRLFAHGEYRVFDPLLLNLGAMLETDDISGTNLSPRGGINWRVYDQQSVRLVSSRAVRNQDIYEEYAQTSLTFRNLAPPFPNGSTTQKFFLTQQSPGRLEPEEITSWEVGYFGYYPSLRTDVDVRWFHEKLSKLISDPANFFDFEADNSSWTELTGIEWQARHTMAPGSWAWASYAYIDNDSSHPIERKFTARHSGSIALAHRFASRWTGSAAYFVNRYQNKVLTTYHHAERIDFRAAYDVPLRGATLQLSGNAQCDLDGNPEIFIDNNYEDRVYAYLGVQVTF